MSRVDQNGRPSGSLTARYGDSRDYGGHQWQTWILRQAIHINEMKPVDWVL